jgi:hypothetical protein
MGATPQKDANAAGERNLWMGPVRARILAATTSPMPCRAVRVLPERATASERLGGVGDAVIQSAHLCDQLDSKRAHRTPQIRTRSCPAQRGGRGVGGEAARQARRDELDQQGVEPVDGLGASADKVVAVLGQCPQRGDLLVDGDGMQFWRGPGRDPDREGISLIALAAMAGGQQPHPARQLRGHVHHRDAP